MAARGEIFCNWDGGNVYFTPTGWQVKSRGRVVHVTELVGILPKSILRKIRKFLSVKAENEEDRRYAKTLREEVKQLRRTMRRYKPQTMRLAA